MRCNPNQEPADVVLAFARRAAAAGVNMNLQSMNGMLKYFCDRRQCTKNLPQAQELNIDGVGKLVCPPWREPASLVEEFAAQASGQGMAINQASMNQMMQFFCARMTCFRNVAQPIKLDVTGVGSLTVQPWQEPADMVETFAGQAMKAGAAISGEGMKQMMEYFCSRRECKRLSLQMPQQQQQAQPITLNVEGVGSLTVNPNQDPADVVESFAAQAVQAGVPMTGESMVQMMEYFCSRRQCSRMQISPPQQQMGGMASKMAQQQQQQRQQYGTAGIAAAAANPATFDEPLILRL